MHMDIKIHIISYKSHRHKAAIFRFKTHNKHYNGDNTRNINKTYYLGGIQKIGQIHVLFLHYHIELKKEEKYHFT